MVAFSKVISVAVAFVSLVGATSEAPSRNEIFRRSAELMTIKESFWAENQNFNRAAEHSFSIKNNAVVCTNGKVTVEGTDYPCNNVDFLSLVGRAELKRTREEFSDKIFDMSDVWGWVSPSGREITLACMTNVFWFIDSTDPINPKPLGWLPSHREESYWCDVKVYKDTAYIVQDRLSGSIKADRGIQVFDLLRLEDPAILNTAVPIEFEVDFTYAEHGAVHNIVIDTETGLLVTVGTNGGNDCDGGLHMIDVATNRLEPTFLGCAAQDGYIHDAQCLVYSGPDSDYTGHEICFGYNEDTLTIYDVSDTSNPRIVSKTAYKTSAYTHQGWINSDQDFLLLDDELDEDRGKVGNTTTYIVDISNLDAPKFTGSYQHPVVSIDHNLYFWGDIHARGWGGNPAMANPPNVHFAYCANYESGMRIIDTTNIKDAKPVLSEAGFFDVTPSRNANEFFGAWSTYMHPSGVIAINAIESGVFFVNFRNAFISDAELAEMQPPKPDTDSEGSDGGISAGVATVLYAFAAFFVGAAVMTAFIKNQQKRKANIQQESKMKTNIIREEPASDDQAVNPLFDEDQA